MIETIISAVVSVLVSFPLGIMFERRKKTAEARSAELNNVEKELEIYRKMLDDANEMIDMLRRRGEDLEKKLESYKAENAKLRQQVNEQD